MTLMAMTLFNVVVSAEECLLLVGTCELQGIH